MLPATGDIPSLLMASVRRAIRPPRSVGPGGPSTAAYARIVGTPLRILIGIGAGLVVAWILLVVVLLLVRPKGSLLREVRVRLWLLFAYLAIPIDLIPDFLPVIGYADDAVIVAVVLRSVVRRAGGEAIGKHWPGSEDGLAPLWRVARLSG